MFEFIKHNKERAKKRQLYNAIVRNNIKLLKDTLNSGVDPDCCIDDKGHEAVSAKVAIDYDNAEALRLISLYGGKIKDACCAGVTDALFYALESNSVNCALYIASLDDESYYYCPNANGYKNIIVAAVYTGELKVIEAVIDKVKRNDKDFIKLLNPTNSSSPIAVAYSLCRPDIVRLLINNGALAKLRTDDALDCLSNAITLGSYETCKLILDTHENIFKEPKNSKYSNKSKNYPLITACGEYFDNKEAQLKIVELLIERGEGPNSEELFGTDPLISAIHGGNKHVAKLLIEKGANLNGTVSHHPLISSIECDDFDTASLILEKAGDSLIVNKQIGFMLVVSLIEFLKKTNKKSSNVCSTMCTLLYSINKNINVNAIINNIKLGEVKDLKLSDISKQ